MIYYYCCCFHHFGVFGPCVKSSVNHCCTLFTKFCIPNSTHFKASITHPQKHPASSDCKHLPQPTSQLPTIHQPLTSAETLKKTKTHPITRNFNQSWQSRNRERSLFPRIIAFSPPMHNISPAGLISQTLKGEMRKCLLIFLTCINDPNLLLCASKLRIDVWLGLATITAPWSAVCQRSVNNEEGRFGWGCGDFEPCCDCVRGVGGSFEGHGAVRRGRFLECFVVGLGQLRGIFYFGAELEVLGRWNRDGAVFLFEMCCHWCARQGKFWISLLSHVWYLEIGEARWASLENHEFRKVTWNDAKLIS